MIVWIGYKNPKLKNTLEQSTRRGWLHVFFTDSNPHPSGQPWLAEARPLQNRRQRNAYTTIMKWTVYVGSEMLR